MLANVHSPPGTIVMATVSVVLERGDMGLDPQNKEGYLAAKRQSPKWVEKGTHQILVPVIEGKPE